MNEDIREYIDDKFQKLESNLKWVTGILLAILMAVLGFYGRLMYRLDEKQKEHSFAISVIEAEMETFTYKTEWLVELGEIQRNVVKQYSKNEDLTDLLEELNKMNRRIMAGSQGRPTMRGH